VLRLPRCLPAPVRLGLGPSGAAGSTLAMAPRRWPPRL